MTYAPSVVNQFMHNSKKAHLQAIHQILLSKGHMEKRNTVEKAKELRSKATLVLSLQLE